MEKEWFDILILTPLREEAAAIFKIFDFRENRSTETMMRAVVDTGLPNVTAILAQSEGMGPRQAGNAIQACLSDYDIGLIVCVGIAGGISADVKVGDVCYGDKIYDILENTKAKSKGRRGVALKFSPIQYNTPREVVAAIEIFQTLPDTSQSYKDWQLSQRTLLEDKISSLKSADVFATYMGQMPCAMSGAIACGMVSSSDDYNLGIKEIDRKILIVETESGPIFEKALQLRVPALTIRGVSDAADNNKSNIERVGEGVFREIAALNAASFLKLKFQNEGFLRYVSKRKMLKLPNLPPVSDIVSTSPFESLIEAVTEAVEKKISEYSLEFLNKTPGYSLPIPRILKANSANVFTKPTTKIPEHIYEAIGSCSVIFVKIPRNYPDPSLPWIIARDILGRGIDNKVMVPFVTDFTVLKPPRGTLASGEMGEFFTLSKAVPEVVAVHIVDGAAFDTKVKTEHLLKMMKEQINSKFLIIARADEGTVFASEFVMKSSAVEYKLCEVSFYEIAKFVQRHFDMDEAQAEATALKLRKTFTKFHLDAHPTYFAGISRDILLKILEANRRTELIGLAVSGFLSFVVAGDRDDVSLSRSTRERFLRLLAVDINVHKRTFDFSSLIEFTKEFARLHDFAIDVRTFINGFIDNGILRESNQYINFSLFFVEKYLLATELKEQEDLGLKYFDLDNADFDFSAFDIYAEIGPSKRFVEQISQKLARRAKAIRETRSRANILLARTVHPRILSNTVRLSQVQSQISRLTEDVNHGRSHFAEKQKLLDVIDRAQQETSQTVSRVRLHDPFSEDSARAQSDADQLLFSVAVYLVGSGAEYLKGDEKSNIADATISIGNSLIDCMTMSYSTVEFAEIKAALLTDTLIGEFLDGDGDEAIDDAVKATKKEEIKKFLDGFLDFVEYIILSSPFRQVISFISDYAHNKVLGRTLEKMKFDDVFDRLLHSIWLADVAPKTGYTKLNESFRELPDTLFLRINLSTHLLIRAYWSHWKKGDRLLLLEAAAQSLLSAGMQLSAKGEIKRHIESEYPDKKQT